MNFHERSDSDGVFSYDGCANLFSNRNNCVHRFDYANRQTAEKVLACHFIRRSLLDEEVPENQFEFFLSLCHDKKMMNGTVYHEKLSRLVNSYA